MANKCHKKRIKQALKLASPCSIYRIGYRKTTCLTCLVVFVNHGKYHCTVDLLFDWFGFNQQIKYIANST